MINFKMIRAKVIKNYLGTDKKVVCFSSGNASKYLLEEGLDVLCIGGYNGVLEPKKWFTIKEIKHWFPDCFDATSGHLPIDLMIQIGEAFKKEIGDLDDSIVYNIPSGSGETLVCLALAYPNIRFKAVYDNSKPYTTYDEHAPLNKLVEQLAESVIIKEG